MSVSAPQPSDILTGRYRLDRTEPWKALLRRLRVANQFGFLPLFAPEDAGVEIARRALEAWLLEKGEKLFTLTIHPDDPPEIITKFLIEAMENPSSIHWVQASPLDPALVKEEQLAARWLHPVHALNARRNELQRALQAPLIFAGPEAFSPFLRDNAPDIWDIRGASFYLDPPEEDAAKVGRDSVVGEDFSIPGDPEFSLGLAKDLKGTPERDLERAALLSRAARQYVSAWNLSRALETMQESHEILVLAGAEWRVLANSYDGLARIFTLMGKFKEALPLQRFALEIFEVHLGEFHPEVAVFLNGLGGHLQRLGRYSEAERYFRRALAIDRKSFGDDHLEVAGDLNNLGNLLRYLGKFNEAEPLLKRALEITEKGLGKDDLRVAVLVNNLGLALADSGKFDEAEFFLRRALEINMQVLGDKDPGVATILNNLGGLLQDRGKLAEAEELIQRALRIIEEMLGADHPSVAPILNNLGGLLRARGRQNQAEKNFLRALKIDEDQLGLDHPDVSIGLNNLAGLLRSMGRVDEALALYRRMLTNVFIHRKRDGLPTAFEPHAIENYGRVLLEIGKTPEEISAEIEGLRKEAGLW